MRASLLSVCASMALVLALSGCELLGDTKVPDFAQIETISYTRHVQFLLDEQCSSCHTGDDAEAGLRLTSWEAVVEGSDFGGIVVPFDPERSPLYAMVSSLVGGPHPAEAAGDTLSAAEVAFLRRWIAEGAQADDGRIPYADAASRVYTAGSILTILDAERLAVAATVDLGALGFGTARYVAAAPDGSAWYVSIPDEDAVLRLTPGGHLDGLATVSSAGPVSVSPDGSMIVVGMDPNALREDTVVSLIRTQDLSVQVLDTGVTRPQAVAIHPQGRVIAVSFDQDRLVTIDPSDGAVQSLAMSGTRLGVTALAVAPDGNRTFAMASTGGRVVVFDSTDPTQLAQIAVVDAGAAPSGLALGDSRVAVSSSGAHTVALIDPVRLTVSDVVRGDAIVSPNGIAAAAGRYFVSSSNTTGQYAPRHHFGLTEPPSLVAVIDAVSGEIVRVLELDSASQALSATQ